MSELNHTPEPWAQGKYCNDEIIAGNVSLFSNDATGGPVHSRQQKAANTNRIVACVNACAGLTTKELNLYAKDGTLRDYLRETFSRNVDQSIEINRIKKNHDELCALVKQLLENVSAYPSAMEADHNFYCDEWSQKAAALLNAAGVEVNRQ